METAYRIVQNAYRLEDAQNHLRDYFYGDPDMDEAVFLEQFQLQNGFSFETLTKPDSSLYVLQDIVDRYSDCHDCNAAENDMYESIIEEYIRQHPILCHFQIIENFMNSPVREAAILRLLEESHWSREDTEAELMAFSDHDIEKGYSPSVCYGSEAVIDGAEVIERIDILCMFDSDMAAAMQAEKDGIKIIHDIPEIEDWCYLDTPANRDLIQKHLAQHRNDLENTSLQSAVISLDSMISDAKAKQEGSLLSDPLVKGDKSEVIVHE